MAYVCPRFHRARLTGRQRVRNRVRVWLTVTPAAWNLSIYDEP